MLGFIAALSRPRLAYDRRLFRALRRVRPWRPQDLVLDVGANDGRTVRRLLGALPSPRIIAFEPVAQTYHRLCKDVQAARNVECLQLGLSAAPGARRIYLDAASALNSLEADWSQAPLGSELVQLETLDRFLAQRGLSQVALLKIDAEGHDLAILQGAKASLAAGAFELIQVEAGFGAPGRPQPTLSCFQEFLAPFEYYLYGIYNQCRANLARRMGDPARISPGAAVLVYGDALFVRGREPGGGAPVAP